MLSASPRTLRRELLPLSGSAGDYDTLLELIGEASFVLLGEASHGTHEFYRERARITRRLIAEKGFRAVAVEADWPDAYRVNRYLHGAPEDADAEEALRGFRRFPTWMWRNAEVLDFVGWLREHNDRSPAAKASFFGLDLYSLATSSAAVIDYLEGIDRAAADRARERYGCFEQFGGEQDYGRAASLGISTSCRQGVVDQLLELRRSAAGYLRRDGIAAEDEQFYAEENARLVANAEEYYRAMFAAPAASWNLRDRHMAETLFRLRRHLSRHSEPAKLVVWEHNSHVGDARMTEMSRRGELNLGQLVREHSPNDCLLLGFTTYRGTVTAASAWDAPAERKLVRPALAESWESLLHSLDGPRFFLDLSAPGAGDRPLERTAGWELGEPPETFPSAP